jgi:hypothetical protein
MVDFTQKKEQCLNIGDIAIDLNYRTGGFSFAHEYKTDEAKEYLSNNYPALAEQLVEAPYYSGMITHNYL